VKQDITRWYYVYIVTNFSKNVIYVGVTNDLKRRITEHYFRVGSSFTSKYNLFNLVYFERTPYILDAIKREKEIKGWRRSKKNALINSFNPGWRFLNKEVFGKWPPDRL
jgi:putative endonuclease